jgi:hypothetical protein
VVYFPENNHPPYIRNKWVLVKKAVTGEPLRFKARIVPLGCHQYGYDGEVYAPTAHIVTVRMIIALSIQNNESLYKLDIKDAFPQCEEKSELYTIIAKRTLIVLNHTRVLTSIVAVLSGLTKFD